MRSIEELMGLGRVYVTRRTDNRLLSTWLLEAGVVERIMDCVVVDVVVGWLKLALMLGGMRDSGSKLGLLLVVMVMATIGGSVVIGLGVSIDGMVEMVLLGEEIGVEHGRIED